MGAGPTAISNKDLGNLKIISLANGTANSDAANYGQVLAAQTFSISRANHTGTQTSATISDFDTQVRTSRIDQLALPTNPVNFNNQRNTNVGDPTSAQDSATKNYVDNSISGLVTGQTLKGAVRVAAMANVNLSAPGTAVDGVTLANGDVVLLTAQTTGTQNGPYVFNGASAPMTRATNWDANNEAVLGSYWIVLQGTKGDMFALLTNDTAITIGTSTPTFAFITSGQGGTVAYTTTCVATAAGSAWVVTHNLNTRFLIAQVARVASPYDFVDVRIERTSVNTVSVMPDIALNAGDYEIMIHKVA